MPEAKIVLVVDDEPVVRTVIADFLVEEGFEVVQSASPAEARDAVQSGIKVDAAIIDVNLGADVDGHELAEELVQSLPDLRVILASGDAQTLHAPWLATYLQKPFTAVRLYDALDRAMRALL